MPAFVSLLLIPLARAQAPAAPPGYAIVHARIEVGNGQVVENGTVVVRGDRIAAVGTDPAPADVTIIDGKGLTVYPGFIDAYSTSGVTLPEARPSGADVPDTTTTAPATMWHENRKGIRADVRAVDHLSLKAPFIDRFKEGITTVLVSCGSGTLAGTAALVDLADKPKVLVPEAAEEINLSAPARTPRGAGRAAQDPTPAYVYPLTLFGTTALMRQTLWDAKDYAAQGKSTKTDPTYEGLRPLVTGRMPAMFTLTNAREIARAEHLCDEFGFKMIVNGVPDAYRMVDVLKRENAPVIVSLDLALEPRRRPADADDTVPQRVLDDRYDAYKERMTNAKRLDAAGIVIAFRSGTSGYLGKVRELVKASGLSRDAALRGMTLGAARVFGVADRLGTIEPGKTANLVLMTGDFLDEKSTVETTLVEGVPHDLKESAK